LCRKGLAFLDVSFPEFSCPVGYFDQVGTPTMLTVPEATLESFKRQTNTDNDWMDVRCFVTKGSQWFIDPEVSREMENPTATKHFKLTKNFDGFLSPETSVVTKKLEAVVNKSPLEEISSEEKRLLWKYRKWLQRDKTIGTNALTKFLRCVDWSVQKEVSEALTLLEGWTEIDIADALFLLGKHFKGVDTVRNHAVSILRRCTIEKVSPFLLQLVQALRYEHDMRICKLADFLIDMAEKSQLIAIDLYWYLSIASEDRVKGDFYHSYRGRLLKHLKDVSIFMRLFTLTTL